MARIGQIMSHENYFYTNAAAKFLRIDHSNKFNLKPCHQVCLNQIAFEQDINIMHKNKNICSIETIEMARICGLSERRMRSVLKELFEMNLVDRKRNWKSYDYWLSDYVVNYID